MSDDNSKAAEKVMEFLKSENIKLTTKHLADLSEAEQDMLMNVLSSTVRVQMASIFEISQICPDCMAKTLFAAAIGVLLEDTNLDCSDLAQGFMAALALFDPEGVAKAHEIYDNIDPTGRETN